MLRCWKIPQTLRGVLALLVMMAWGVAVAAPVSGLVAEDIAAPLLLPPTPEQRALLLKALERAEQEMRHWAYTETVRDLRSGLETVTRFDPSKPEGERSVVLRVAGKEPTDRELRKWNRKLSRSRAGRETLGAHLDVEAARVFADSSEKTVFDVPLKNSGRLKLPPDRVQVLLHVDKASGAFDHADLGLRRPFRMMLVVKVTELSGTVNFGSVGSGYPKQPTQVCFQGAARLFFRSFNANFVATRSDFRRVKPYDERFEVNIGKLETLGI